jgi:2-hydroxychromene-2-carboxylate isomerase
MQLDGQVWFSFTNPDVWVFYRFVRQLASAGHSVNLDWVPLFDRHEAKTMSTFLAIDDPDDRGRFLHAMLGLIHMEDRSFDDETIVAEALSAAGVETHGAEAGEGDLASLAAEAESLGVTVTPTLYRHGPVSLIRLTEASLMGDVEKTAIAILAVADDDGVWGIVKP